MATSEADVAAKLIERLLVDPAFRARFRRNPAEACREAGLDELAQEMSIGAGKAMMTLDLRESKSSLAGVMMAAAMEGVGVMQFVEHVAPHLDDIPEAIGDVLSRVNLPAIGGSLAGGPKPSAPALPNGAGGGRAADGIAGADPGSTRPRPATALRRRSLRRPRGRRRPARPAAAPRRGAARARRAEDGGRAGGREDRPAGVAGDQERRGGAEGRRRHRRAGQGRSQRDRPARRDERAEGRRRRRRRRSRRRGGARGRSRGSARAPAAATAGRGGRRPPPARCGRARRSGRSRRAARGRGADVVDQGRRAANGPPPDPEQYGMAGGGGPVSAQAKAVLENKNITLDANGKADFSKGKMDPRVAAILLKLGEKHKLTISATTSDHPQNTAGGSVSNHWYGRGMDIATVDGEIVRPNSPAARELAGALADLPESIRPNEVWVPVGDRVAGLLHGCRPSGPHPSRVQAGDLQGLEATRGLEGAGGAAPRPRSRRGLRPRRGPSAAPRRPWPLRPAPGGGGRRGAAGAEGGPVGPVHAAAKAHAASGKKGQSGPVHRGLAAAAARGPRRAAPARRRGAADAAAAAADLGGIGDKYPGDDAPKEQLAAWLGKQAEKRGLPKELPVMASLVESGVKNLNFGDADSVGFFQMRVGIWNQGAYKGFPEKPELQAKWFLDQAEAVKKQRMARGQSVTDPNQFGDWIADIERPAEQYRGRYGMRLGEAKGLLAKAGRLSARGGGASACRPGCRCARGCRSRPAVGRRASAGRWSIRRRSVGPPPDPEQYGGMVAVVRCRRRPRRCSITRTSRWTRTARRISRRGRMDPRVAAILLKLGEKHKLTISSTTSDHPQSTSGGSVSNHWFGRGMDIATVDGEIVRSNSPAARELASALAELPESIRPSEVGSPWAIASPGFFTDAGHQDHIHLAFKQAIAPDWSPRPGLEGAAAAAGAPVAAAAVAGAPAPAGAPAAAAAAPVAPKAGDSGQFMAAKAEAAGAGKGDSGQFMAARAPAGPASALAAPRGGAGRGRRRGRGDGVGCEQPRCVGVAGRPGRVGVHESGVNTGAEVDKYLAAAGVGPGNPWCASFVTWSLAQSGHKMEGSGWAAVQTWVRNAEARQQPPGRQRRPGPPRRHRRL